MPIVFPVVLLGQIITTFLVGGQVVLHDSPVPSVFWSGYAAGSPKTFLLTSPGSLVALLADPAAERVDHRHLRLWVTGGDLVPAGIHARFRITGHSLIEMFGMTEAGFIALNRMTDPQSRGCMGAPMRGVEYRIVGSDGANVPIGEVGESTCVRRT